MPARQHPESQIQRAVADHLRLRVKAAGAEVAIATGIDEAIKQLEAWQLLRGRVT